MYLYICLSIYLSAFLIIFFMVPSIAVYHFIPLLSVNRRNYSHTLSSLFAKYKCHCYPSLLLSLFNMQLPPASLSLAVQSFSFAHFTADARISALHYVAVLSSFPLCPSPSPLLPSLSFYLPPSLHPQFSLCFDSLLLPSPFFFFTFLFLLSYFSSSSFQSLFLTFYAYLSPCLFPFPFLLFLIPNPIPQSL